MHHLIGPQTVSINCLYYKPITVVNDDWSIVNIWLESLTDDTTVVIYDRNMFIIQATAEIVLSIFSFWNNSIFSFCSILLGNRLPVKWRRLDLGELKLDDLTKRIELKNKKNKQIANKKPCSTHYWITKNIFCQNKNSQWNSSLWKY